ncbi:methylated-DNA--[protein]-cysteine S-methyltransferase [Desulfovibrio sp. ZJ200]|uniref:methylated-DNA--[protein]-cysteine S-methyltransferase n=1 Tax=Desulfovibrio sp. ZJ200 TaxID=2709792 RepID=UPI0013EDAC05|nr:methylated-DNA--[protein]-cysteine S-methyltransferase [Desulfovibrio sp. ZJ200]
MLGLSAKGKSAVPADALCQESPILRRARAQLEEYLAGRRRSFDLPLAPRGTDFQRKVWEALTRIPYGETRSYKQIAEAVGCPRGCRAVGLANNRNPISIVIPCHRVIGADGSLVGYGGGLPLKKALLRLEGSL